MTQENAKYLDAHLNFWKEYKELFQNKVLMVPTLGEYFYKCEYKHLGAELIHSNHQCIRYRPEILKKYKEYLLFAKHNTSEGVPFEFVFNFRDHFHLFCPVYLYQEEVTKENKFACMPAIYTDSVEKIAKFYDDNEEFKIRPVEPRKPGFMGMQ